MPKPLCHVCRLRKIRAKGLCSPCYSRMWRAKRKPAESAKGSQKPLPDSERGSAYARSVPLDERRRAALAAMGAAGLLIF